MAGKSHIGKAGHLAAMAEFLLRGYNVAQPEVDVGDDIFVVHDMTGKLSRIQVKTAIGKSTRYGWSGQFFIAEEQLGTERNPDLYYLLALRQLSQWEFLVVPRLVLNDEYLIHQVGTLNNSVVTFTMRFHEMDVRCSTRSFQRYRNDWSNWPTL